MPRTYAILGGTGAQGGATIDWLIGHSPAARIRTLTRRDDDPRVRTLRASGVEVLGGDYGDPAILRSLLGGVDGLFLNTTFFNTSTLQADFDLERRQADRIIQVARAMAVPHLVFSTSPRTGGVPHMDVKADIEEMLEASGLPTSLVSTCNYMDNFRFYPMYKPVLEDGVQVFRLPFPDDRILPTISVRDIGAFAAMCLLDPDRFAGRRLRVSGSELTPVDMVRVYADITGQRACYRALSAGEWRALGWPISDEFIAMFDWYANAGSFTDLQASRNLHPELESWPDWLRRTNWRGE